MQGCPRGVLRGPSPWVPSSSVVKRPLRYHRSTSSVSLTVPRRRRRYVPPPSAGWVSEYDLVGPYHPKQDTTDTDDLPCPDLFRPGYVLSVRPERLSAFMQRLGPWSTHIRRAPCVVGASLNLAELERTGQLSPRGRNLRPGEVGCWLSHYRAWEAIAASPYEYGTVFEDDAPVECSARVVEALRVADAEQKGLEWDMLVWCRSPHVPVPLHKGPGVHWSRVPANYCLGGIAYTLKTSVARRWVREALPITCAVDVWMASTFGTLAVYALEPMLGTVLRTDQSDTGHTTTPSYFHLL